MRSPLPNFRIFSQKEFLFSCLEIAFVVVCYRHSLEYGLAAYLFLAALYGHVLYEKREFVPKMKNDSKVNQIGTAITFGMCWPLLIICCIIGLVLNLTRRNQNV